MTAPAAFFADVAPDAKIASARTGVPVSVILAQWAIETGYGTSSAWLTGHNYAGVSPGGHVASYTDRPSGLAAYISTLSSQFYAAVRGAGSPSAAAVALGDSPWAASHYGGHGADLQTVITTNNLARFDTGATLVTGPAGPAGGSDPGGAIDKAAGIGGAINGLATTNWADMVKTMIFLGGGLGLVVLGVAKMAEPAIAKAKASAGDAAKVAALV